MNSSTSKSCAKDRNKFTLAILVKDKNAGLVQRVTFKIHIRSGWYEYIMTGVENDASRYVMKHAGKVKCEFAYAQVER